MNSSKMALLLCLLTLGFSDAMSADDNEETQEVQEFTPFATHGSYLDQINNLLVNNPRATNNYLKNKFNGRKKLD